MPQNPCNGRRWLLAATTLTGALLANGPGAWAQEAAPSVVPPQTAISAGKPAPDTTASEATAPTTGTLAVKGSPQGAKARPAQAPTAMVVPAARNAIDLALEQVPAGVSVEQFLVALFRLNPGAFAEGKIHQLSAGAHLQLPTVEQARALNQERARAELQILRQGALATPPPPPSGAADAPASSGAGATPTDVQTGATPAPGPEANPSTPASAGTKEAVSAAVQAQGLPIHPWLLISSGGALLILLFLAFRPSEEPRKPQAAADMPAPKAADSSQSPTRNSVSSVPAPKSLADFGPLPSLDLGDGPASGSTRAAPQAPAPFDLSRISLDLDPEDKRPS